MNDIMEVLGKLDLTMESESIVEVVKLIYYKDIITMAIRIGGTTILFSLMFCMIFTAVKNFGTGKWKG